MIRFKKMSSSEEENSISRRLRMLDIPEPRPILEPIPVRVFHCLNRGCTEWFNDESEYETHKFECQEAPLECPNCALKFRTRREKLRHRPFCQRRFGIQIVERPRRLPQVLRSIRRVRTKIYKCRHCRKKFRTEEGRYNHERTCQVRLQSGRWVLKL